MFQFPSFAPTTYVFSCRYLPYGKWVSPFGHHRITGRLPPPRCFSQAPTSFIASDCQGIHRIRLVTWPYNQSYLSKKTAPTPLMHRAGTETDSDQTICPPDVVTLVTVCITTRVATGNWNPSPLNNLSMNCIPHRSAECQSKDSAWFTLLKNFPVVKTRQKHTHTRASVWSQWCGVGRPGQIWTADLTLIRGAL